MKNTVERQCQCIVLIEPIEEGSHIFYVLFWYISHSFYTYRTNKKWNMILKYFKIRWKHFYMHIQCLQVKDRVGTSEQGGELTKVGLSKTDQGRTRVGWFEQLCQGQNSIRPWPVEWCDSQGRDRSRLSLFRGHHHHAKMSKDWGLMAQWREPNSSCLGTRPG